MNSHVYALRTTTQSKQVGVYATDGENEKAVASSFDEFLRAYLANPEEIANCW
jgi:hypothetical protein